MVDPGETTVFDTLIYGAGSIGNHLCYGCRQMGWNVTIYDIDEVALSRTRDDIYPSRYGAWDQEIELVSELDGDSSYDLVIIGTPPDTHETIAIDVLSHNPPKVLLIEKPLCPPAMLRCSELVELSNSVSTQVLVGYNHTLTKNTERAEEKLRDGAIGEVMAIHVRWLENWQGIFEAHPWLAGPSDSYLGFSDRGGGACAEHSHGISLWQHFAEFLDMGGVREVTAVMDRFIDELLDHDKASYLSLKTENCLIGTVMQDVITTPPQKVMRIQGSEGYLEWYANFDEHHDALIYESKGTQQRTELIDKTRPHDFLGEIQHIQRLLEGSTVSSPIALNKGIQTMSIISAAHLSNRHNKTIQIEPCFPFYR